MKSSFPILFAVVATGVCAADAPPAAGSIVTLTNTFRAQLGLAPLRENETLAQTAQDYARHMADTGRLGHAADGRTPSERAVASGYEYCMIAENVGTLYADPPLAEAELAGGLVDGWKDSPEHRKNLAEPAATDIGVGMAQGEGGRWYAVQMFGRPRSAAIRFEVENRSGEPIGYRAGERSFTLEPRARSTHVVCNPVEIEISPSPRGSPFFEQIGDEVRYTVWEDGTVTRTRPPR